MSLPDGSLKSIHTCVIFILITDLRLLRVHSHLRFIRGELLHEVLIK